ncbi:MAG: type III pantothenate kinase [Planctomycetota bacterium]
MRFLAIDLGNTHLSWGVFQDEKLLATGKLDAAKEWSLPLPEWDSLELAALASVNRECEPRLAESWKWSGAPPLEWLGRDSVIPVETRVRDRRQVGADRLLNALAWHQRSSLPAVIIDFGTAVTFDLIAGDGAYLGGLILPGPELISLALNLETSLLPRVEIFPTPEIFGQDTEVAVRRGVFGLLLGGLEFHIRELRRCLDKDTVFLATGGGAARLAPWCEGVELVAPHLTLEGIRLAWKASRGE